MSIPRLKIVISALLNYTLLLYADEKQPAECFVVKPDIFSDCDGRLILSRYSHKLPKHRNISEEICINKAICQKHFNVSYFRRQIYSTRVFKLFFEMLQGCCGNCFSYTTVNNFTNLSQLDKTSMKTSDFIFPVLGSLLVTELYGFKYIPLIEVSSAYYLTSSETARSKMRKLVIGCLSMWPMLCVCVLMSLISGVIIWITERKGNSKEFPTIFRSGFFEGFWWSFVSMTTVGYGDKIPKSYPGRLYACFWILTGISMFSIFTATLTSLISDINSNNPPEMLGKRVGGLLNRLHDSSMVAQHGGFFQGLSHNGTIHDITELILRLDRKEIDGILLSRSTYYYFSRMIHEDRYAKCAEKVKDVILVKTEKFFRGERLTQGMLVKDPGHYRYFRTFFKDNWLQIQDCESFVLNNKSGNYLFHDAPGLSIGIYLDLFYVTLGILGLAILFGLFQEACSYRDSKRKKNDQEEDRTLNETEIRH